MKTWKHAHTIQPLQTCMFTITTQRPLRVNNDITVV